MYLQHFGLRSKPFQIAPSPRMLYPSESHDEGRARILYGVRENRGFVVVTGGIGLGKTTVLMSVLDELEAEVHAALIFNPVDEFPGLLRLICAEFGVETDGTEVGSLVALNHWLIARHAEHGHCVLLIDEAQNLPLPVLERLRLLSNLQTEEHSLLQIVLVGQPELYERLCDSRLVQLRQRIGVWHEIVPLSKLEVVDYVYHRLRLSGAPRPREIFEEEVCHVVHELTGGIPRLINQLCDTALVMAYGAQQGRITSEILREAAIELRLLAPPPKRVTAAAAAPAPVQRAAAKPARSLPWRALAAVALLSLFGLLIWRQWAWIERRLPLTGWQQEVSTPIASAAPATALVEAASPAPVPAAPTQRELSPLLRENARLAESLRARGQSVYGVHLASFETEAAAQRYADELLERAPAWPQPLYLVPQPDRRWFRVVAGAFEHSAEARRWATELRQAGGVSYAQVAPLPQAASSLLEDDMMVSQETGSR